MGSSLEPTTHGQSPVRNTSGSAQHRIERENFAPMEDVTEHFGIPPVAAVAEFVEIEPRIDGSVPY